MAWQVSLSSYDTSWKIGVISRTIKNVRAFVHETHNLLINTEAELRMEDTTIQESLYVARKCKKTSGL